MSSVSFFLNRRIQTPLLQYLTVYCVCNSSYVASVGLWYRLYWSGMVNFYGEVGHIFDSTLLSIFCMFCFLDSMSSCCSNFCAISTRKYITFMSVGLYSFPPNIYSYWSVSMWCELLKKELAQYLSSSQNRQNRLKNVVSDHGESPDLSFSSSIE